MNKLHYYLGSQAKATDTRDSRAKTKYYTGLFGAASLKEMEENPRTFIVRPVLKPLEAAYENGDISRAMIRAITTSGRDKVDTSIAAVRYCAEISNILRAQGYDCDGLIETGDAECHADYDVKYLL